MVCAAGSDPHSLLWRHPCTLNMNCNILKLDSDKPLSSIKFPVLTLSLWCSEKQQQQKPLSLSLLPLFCCFPGYDVPAASGAGLPALAPRGSPWPETPEHPGHQRRPDQTGRLRPGAHLQLPDGAHVRGELRWPYTWAEQFQKKQNKNQDLPKNKSTVRLALNCTPIWMLSVQCIIGLTFMVSVLFWSTRPHDRILLHKAWAKRAPQPRPLLCLHCGPSWLRSQRKIEQKKRDRHPSLLAVGALMSNCCTLGSDDQIV